MAYKWHLVIGHGAQMQINLLTRKDRMLIFERIKDLLDAENPTDPDEVKGKYHDHHEPFCRIFAQTPARRNL